MGSDRQLRVDSSHSTGSQLGKEWPATGHISSLHIGAAGMPERSREFDRQTFGLTGAMATLGHPTGLLIADEVPGDDVPRHVEVRRFAAKTEPLVRRWLDVKETFSQAAQKQRPDIVVSHFALYAVALLDDLKRLPHVVHYYGPSEGAPIVSGERGWAHFHERRQERAVYESADLVIVYSEPSRRRLIDDFDIDRDRIRLIPVEFKVAPLTACGGEDCRWHEVAAKVLDIYREAIGQG